MAPTLRLSTILISFLSLNIFATEAQGFVARHNLPVNRPIPSGFVRASDLANADSSVPLNGPVRPVGQLPVAQDMGSVASASQQVPPKDPFQSAQSVVQPPPQQQQGPTPEQIQALIDSEQRLPGRSPSMVNQQGPLGPDPQMLQAMQAQETQSQPKIVYVPVPVPAAQVAPVATAPPPPANLPSWMTHPLSGNLPWNGR